MIRKNIKAAAILLLILVFSSTFEFPFYFKTAMAQSIEESKTLARKLAFSNLSFQHDLEDLKKEGIFYCSKPVEIESGKKYEYYLFISNPNKKKISISFYKMMGQAGAELLISYWEPLFPEQNTQADESSLSTTDELVFRAYQVITEPVFGIIPTPPPNPSIYQDGGEKLEIIKIEDCKGFFALVYFGIAETTTKVLDNSGYNDAKNKLTEATIQGIGAIVSFWSQRKPSYKRYVFGDGDFAKGLTQNFLNIIDSRYARDKNFRFAATELFEVHDRPLTLEEIMTMHDFIVRYGPSFRSGTAGNIYVNGNHDLNILYSIERNGEVIKVPDKQGSLWPTNAAYIDSATLSRLEPEARNRISNFFFGNPIVAREGDTLYMHHLNTYILDFIMDHPELIDVPTSEWCRVIINEGKAKDIYDAITYIHNELIFKDRIATGLSQNPEQVLQGKYLRWLRENGISQIVYGHTEVNTPLGAEVERTGIKVYRVCHRTGEVEPHTVPYIDQKGNVNRKPLSEAREQVVRDHQTLTTSSYATDMNGIIEYINDNFEIIKSSKDFQEMKGTLLDEINKLEDLVIKSLEKEGRIGRGQAPGEVDPERGFILTALQDMRAAINDNDLNVYNKGVDTLYRIIEVRNEHKGVEAVRIAMNAEQVLLEEIKVGRENLFTNLYHTTLEMAKTRDYGPIIERMKGLLQAALNNHLLTEEEYNNWMAKIKGVEEGKIAPFDLVEMFIKQANIVRTTNIKVGRVNLFTNLYHTTLEMAGTFDHRPIIERMKGLLQAALNNHLLTEEEYNNWMAKIKGVEEGKIAPFDLVEMFIKQANIEQQLNKPIIIEAKKEGETISSLANQVVKYQDPIQKELKLLSEKENLLKNQKGLTDFLKREEIKVLKFFPTLDEKLGALTRKLEAHPRLVGAAMAVLQVISILSPIIEAEARERFGANSLVYYSINLLLIATHFVQYILLGLTIVDALGLFCSFLAGSAVAGEELAAFLLNWGIGYVVILFAIAAMFFIYCSFISPDSSVCLCNFSKAKFAILPSSQSKTTRPSYSSTIDATVRAGETYTIYVADATGKGCEGVVYKFSLVYRRVVDASSQPFRMTCDREGKCAGSADVTIPSNHPWYSVKLYSGDNLWEVINNPVKWAYYYVGKLTISSQPPQPSSPSQPTQPSQPTVKLTLSGFTCDSNERKCEVQYINEETESFKVRFYLIKDGKVVEIDEKTIPAAQVAGSKNSGSIQTKTFGCPAGAGTYNIMFQIFKSSDSKFINPIISPLNIGEIGC
jgi:hypothetical protein